MDLISQCSVLESEGDDENGYENSGSFGLTPYKKGTDKNEASIVGSTTKAKGLWLKRWKGKIRRDVVKDPNLCVDHSKILKRGLSGGFGSNLTKNVEDSIYVGSSNVFGNAVIPNGYEIGDSDSDSRYAHGFSFFVGNDSENREDRSIAASAPKLRHVRGKSQNKNVSWKNLTNLDQQGKGQGDSSKKRRSEGVKSEKENSHSSNESDSRSSNFKHGIFNVTNNGKHSDEDENFTAEDSCCNEKMRIVSENLATNLSWEVKEEKREHSQSSTVNDPLSESICSLQAAQEALEQGLSMLFLTSLIFI